MQALIYWGAVDASAKEVRTLQPHSVHAGELLKHAFAVVRS